MPFKFNKQKRAYKPKIGDVRVYGDHNRYTRTLNQAQLSTSAGLTAMPLAWVSPNTWYSLTLLNFDDKHIQQLRKSCTNDCPYYPQQYYALVPLFIFAKDPTAYFKHYAHKPFYQDIMSDDSWNRQGNGFENWDKWDFEESLSRLVHSAMGSGYTPGIMQNDGSASKVPVLMDVDNGDIVLAVTWEWYNK